MVHRRLLCIAVLAAAAGCASPLTQLRDENHRLNKNIEQLRDDKREQERQVADLTHQLDELRAKLVTSTFDGSMPQHLPVEVVEPTRGRAAQVAPAAVTPGGGRVVAVADDGTEIVYEGDAAAGKVAVLDPDDDQPPPAREDRAPRRAEPAPPPADAPAIADAPKPHDVAHAAVAARRAHARVDREPTVANDAAASDYRAAVDLIKAGKHEDAITALRAFIAAYPHHEYADNAQYWLGEAYYAQHDYQRALVEFRATIETYPRGNKVPDALLKVGYCYAALGQADRAHAVLEQVVNLYPKSEPAGLAQKRLEAKP
jgi:tol-pal system protein YbgF